MRRRAVDGLSVRAESNIRSGLGADLHQNRGLAFLAVFLRLKCVCGGVVYNRTYHSIA